MGNDGDPKDVSIVAEDEDSSDETIVTHQLPPMSADDGLGLSDLGPDLDDELDLPSFDDDEPAPPVRPAPPPRPLPSSSSPPLELAGFGDDDDDDATEALSRDELLADLLPVGRKLSRPLPRPEDRPRARALKDLSNLPLTAGTAEGDAMASASVPLVAEDDDDDDPATTVLRPPPRRLASLPPIDVDEPDDATLSRPIVHRQTVRPSGEGSPRRALDDAGGAVPSAWSPKGARSVIALPVNGGASNTVQAKGPPTPPPENLDLQDETHTGTDPAPLLPDQTPDLESLAASLSHGGEHTDTAYDTQPPVIPIDPESETRSLLAQPHPPVEAAAPPADAGEAQEQTEVAADEVNSDTPVHRGPPTAAGLQLEQEISELDEGALVVDDELPPEIARWTTSPADARAPVDTGLLADNRPEPGPPVAVDAAPPPAAASAAAAETDDIFGAAGDAQVGPSVAAPTLPPATNVSRVDFSSELESIADDEPGTLIVQVPAEATVFLDGAEVGQGPLSISGLDRFATYTLRVHCPGYLPWSGSASLRGEAEGEVVPGLRSRHG